MNRTQPPAQRALARTGLAAVAAAGIVLTGAASAWAHVEVDADGAATGASDVTLTFHVPNEEAPAVTTAITFLFPTDHPLAEVSAEPQNGFTPTLTTTHLATEIPGTNGPVSDAVSQITFAGGTIQREDDPAFVIHVGKLPDGVAQLTFTAMQTYDNGTVVAWTDPTVDGQAEPEHPAPILELGPAAPASEGAATSAPVTVSATAAAPTNASTSGTTAPSSSTLTSTAAVFAGLGLLAAGIWIYLRRTRNLATR
ncbi:MAG: YcnI family protein [Cellulomonas sp.]